jgi:uncharacterized protein (DUF983 family)
LSIFRCPRCGKGRLYRGWLEMNDSCSDCALPFSAREQGDGPAFFAVLLIGALTAIGAAIVEIKLAPPFWLHAAIWIPFTLIGTILGLRVLKAALVGVQYQYRKDDFTP